MTIAADEDWYMRRDGRKKLSPHCPLAANDKCPRYFLSQRHAAAAGVAHLELSGQARARLEEAWATSDVFASVDLSVGTSFAPGGLLSGVEGFCPEVAARIFGLYCSSLAAFPDEDARRHCHKTLTDENAPRSDPRWTWMAVLPRHYTECLEFSTYGGGTGTARGGSNPGKRSLPSRLRFEVLHRDDFRCVYCGKTSSESPLHIDHKISVADGGPDSLENLVVACEECNLGKGAKSVHDR